MRAPKAASVETRPTDDLDTLAGLALEYTTRSARFLTTRSAALIALRTRDPAAEAVLWFHSRIYFLTTRALVGNALAAAGTTDREADASRCAAQTLVAADRSRAALRQLQGHDVERGVLVALLDAIARGIEERFPHARTCASASVPRPRALQRRHV